MVVDYSQAFEPSGWDFINTDLKRSNFGDNLIYMVELIQFGASSKIERNGFLSDRITLERGCRQGDSEKQ